MATFKEIRDFLEKKGVGFKVIDLPDTAISVDDVLRLTNGQVKEEEIVKTLIGKMKDGQFTAFILKGRDRLDTQKILGFARLATKDEVYQVTNVEPGAVCAILLNIPVVIDEKVMELKRVNMGSGDHLKGLEMDLTDLLSVISSHKVEPIT